MRKSDFLRTSLAAGFITASQGAAFAETAPSHPLARSSISLSASEGCQKLLTQDCDGSSTRLEWRSTDQGMGTTRIGLEEYSETFNHTFFDKSLSGRAGSAYASAGWGGNVKGIRLTIDQAFKIADHSQVEIGGFIGHVEARVAAQARADITVNPLSLTLPELNYRGYHLPETELDYKGNKYHAARNWQRKESSADVGVRFATGSAFDVTSNIRAGFSTFGQASLARTSYGAGGAVYYSSSPDSRLGTTAGGLCSGAPLLSSARFAFAAGVCAEKIQQDRIMDAKLRQAQRLSDKVNSATGRIDGYLDEARNLTSQEIPSVATSYSAADAAKFLGLRYDYKKVTPSIILSAAMRVGSNAVVSATYQHEEHDRRANVAVTWVFK